jgi:Rrf2 family transcriptional regulator, cysteine metabolism repressor
MITELPLTVRYALAAAVCLARQDGQRLSARSVAEKTGIPPAFLAKILRELARAGLIDGERGHHGGYRLARPADEVMLGEVVAAVDPSSDLASNVCCMGDRLCDSDQPCAMHSLWSVATAPLRQLVLTVSLARLVSGTL